MSRLHRDEWGAVLTEDGRRLVVDGVAIPAGGGDHSGAAANSERLVAAWNACEGLTPEQVAAVPMLVAWAKWQLSPAPIQGKHRRWKQEWAELAEIFPEAQP